MSATKQLFAVAAAVATIALGAVPFAQAAAGWPPGPTVVGAAATLPPGPNIIGPDI